MSPLDIGATLILALALVGAVIAHFATKHKKIKHSR